MVTSKMPEALQGIYRLVLKNNVRVESVKEGIDMYVWSRKGNEDYKPFWAVLSPNSDVVLDQPYNRLGWKTSERIGVGVINPRSMKTMRSMRGR